ncbi:MAG: GDSL-type esterase/lipase family protein [Candidatus Eremiobacteraeota bacterium]|nr:GDSL-type esterase/lipase family protein [Candidatus Eremiobacteraeota bacterium]
MIHTLMRSALLVLLAFTLIGGHEAGALEVYVRNKPLNERLIEVKGTVYAPLDSLIKLLGFSAEAGEGTAAIVKKAGECSLPQGTFTLTCEGAPLEIPMVIREGRAYVPLREFAEKLGASVLYTKETDIMDITLRKNISAQEIQKSINDMKLQRLETQKKLGTISTFKYVVLGSSSAEGSGADPASKGFACQIGDRLRARFPDLVMKNLARGGKSSSDFISMGLIQQAVQEQPHLVVILSLIDHNGYGMEQGLFRKNWTQIFQSLTSGTKAVIVFGNFYVPGASNSLELKRIIEELAPRYNVKLVDFPDMFKEHPEYRHADGIHPNNKGHDAYTDRFWQVIGNLF